jgi:hypothetical protein
METQRKRKTLRRVAHSEERQLFMTCFSSATTKRKTRDLLYRWKDQLEWHHKQLAKVNGGQKHIYRDFVNPEMCQRLQRPPKYPL